MDFNLGSMLAKRARLDRDKPALVFEGKVFTYNEFNQRTNRWANALTGLGVGRGDRVGILLRN